VDGLWRNPRLADKIERGLAATSGVILAKANANTGRVLVVFEPGRFNAPIDALIHNALTHVDGTDPSEKGAEEGVDELNRAPLMPLPTGRGTHTLSRLIDSVKTRRPFRQWGSTLSIVHTFFYITSAASLGVIGLTVIAPHTPLLNLFSITSFWGRVGFWSGLTFFLKGMESLTDYHARREWQAYSNEVEQTLRLRAFEHIEHLDMSYLESQSTGQLLNRINGDVVKIKHYLERTPDSLIRKVGALSGIGLFMCVYSPALAMFSIFPLPFIYYYAKQFPKKVSKRYDALGKSTDDLHHLLANDLSGLPTIKSYTAEAYEKDRLAAAGSTLSYRMIDAKAMSLQHGHVLQMAAMTGLVAALGLGSILVGYGALPLSVYMIQAVLSARLLVGMTDLGMDFHVYQDAVSAADRLVAVLATQPSITDGERCLDFASLRGEIRFERVSFGYDRPGQVFKEMDLRIPASTTIAIVGSTGSGKTTLVKLLLRFYDADEGRILLDGTDLRELKIRDLRHAIGLVSQDVFLFHGTVYDNILYGRREASFQEVVEAAETAEALDFINRLPRGFETVIGERGQKLSGGQRQRLSIARALLKNPPILVFDEATSSVDYETEVAIQRSIQRIAVGRTTIIIAHRLSTVRHADCIHLLEDGRVREKGTHHELMVRGGAYASLWKLIDHASG
jgi:ATP-binding cassette subfamily B protein